MPGIYPFAELVKRPAGDKGIFVRVGGFYRRMKAIFSDFELTATGATWSNKPPNGLHLDIEGSDSLPFAWRMQASADGITITPGFVLLQAPIFTPDLPSTGFFVPAINSVSLDAEVPPVLAISSLGDTFIVLECVISAADGSPLNLPWQIKAYYNTPPTDTPLVRSYNGSAGQNGTLHLPLAKFTNGLQTVQGFLGRPVSVTWWYNTVIFS